jgi:hypothetical protein
VPSKGLERVKSELAAGRLWKARDRVTGLVTARPADQAVLELARQVFYEMGDLPRAGAYWFLTEKDGPEVESALQALTERYGTGAVGVIDALPVRAVIDAFPVTVQHRLRELQRQAKRRYNYRWEPQPRSKRESAGPTQPGSALVDAVMSVVLLGATLGVWAVGMATIVGAVASWVFD